MPTNDRQRFATLDYMQCFNLCHRYVREIRHARAARQESTEAYFVQLLRKTHHEAQEHIREAHGNHC